MATAVFAGVCGEKCVPFAKKLIEHGIQILTVNSPEAHQIFVTSQIPHRDAAVVDVMSDAANITLVVAGLHDFSLGNVDVGTHSLVRIAVIVDQNDLTLIAPYITPSSVSLPYSLRTELGYKAFKTTSDIDSRIAIAIRENEGSLSAQVLVVGSGGREHAIALKLIESPQIGHVYVAPGNAGTATSGDKISNIPIPVDHESELVSFATAKNISLVIVGPEAPLVSGLSDALSAAGIPCFGPSAAAARLEASKAYSKELFARYGIPTARYRTFTNFDEARAFIDENPYENGLVLKASGLASGKGVLLPTTKEEAIDGAHKIMVEKIFGAAGDELVIEERLEGEEVSVLAFCDGKTVALMPAAQDHKRINDNDEGLNTGGMGAYAPAPCLTPYLAEEVKLIIQRTVQVMAQEGNPYYGVLFAGIMLTANGPMVLEYNVRFGDPETQVLLPLLNSDLFEVMRSCVEGRLGKMVIEWKQSFAATVVAAAAGYPESFPRGMVIHGLDAVRGVNQVTVYHAGTKLEENGGSNVVVCSGGRVLAVTGLGRTVTDSIDRAYEALQVVRFDNMHYRRDIGQKAKNPRLKIGVIGSTRGTDLLAILEAINNGSLHASITVIISNVQTAGILEKARANRIHAKYIPVNRRSREEYDQEVSAALRHSGVELVLLVGYMRILSDWFCREWEGACINVHPSLLPLYKGLMDLDVHRAVIADGRAESGCSIHMVTADVDDGPVVVQKRCPVIDGDTPESLKARVQQLEGQAYIEAIQMYQRGDLKAKDRRKPLTYRDAGVDIDAGDNLVELIKPACKATARTGCDSDLGGFGALFDLSAAGFDQGDTILVSGTDGVGTKLMIAQACKSHATIGIDLVAMSVNDIIVQGAEPLFFLDYYATGHLNVAEAKDVIEGIAKGCVISGCGLVGGETAEMPSMYPPGEYDLAGFAVGAVRRSMILPKNVQPGDILIGLPSSGVHSNGYSLVRKIVEQEGLSYSDPCPFSCTLGNDNQIPSLGQVLLTPTRIYSDLLPLINANLIKGLAHITGGGITGNLPRVLPDDTYAHIDLSSSGLRLPPVFEWIQSKATISQNELLRTFNCGLGMILVVAPGNLETVTHAIQSLGQVSYLANPFAESFYNLGVIKARTDPTTESVVVEGSFNS